MMAYIVMGDNHLRPDRPLCRLDEDWYAEQRAQLDFIVDKANEHMADIVCTGDLFDVPRVPPRIVSMFIEAMVPLMGRCYIIAGNHSLPWHKLENIDDSSIGILKALSQTNKKIVYLPTEEYTENGRFEHVAKLEDDILVIHTLTFPTINDIPYGANATSAVQLLEKYPQARIIFTGDNHTTFVIEDDGRIVANPGCMNIQGADMIDTGVPRVILINTGEKIDVTTLGDSAPVYRSLPATWAYIPIPDNFDALTKNHLDQQKERDDRITSFISTIVRDGQIGLSFEDNLRATMQRTSLEESVRTVLETLIEEDKSGKVE